MEVYRYLLLEDSRYRIDIFMNMSHYVPYRHTTNST